MPMIIVIKVEVQKARSKQRDEDSWESAEFWDLRQFIAPLIDRC